MTQPTSGAFFTPNLEVSPVQDQNKNKRKHAEIEERVSNQSQAIRTAGLTLSKKEKKVKIEKEKEKEIAKKPEIEDGVNLPETETKDVNDEAFLKLVIGPETLNLSKEDVLILTEESKYFKAMLTSFKESSQSIVTIGQTMYNKTVIITIEC